MQLFFLYALWGFCLLLCGLVFAALWAVVCCDTSFCGGIMHCSFPGSIVVYHCQYLLCLFVCFGLFMGNTHARLVGLPCSG